MLETAAARELLVNAPGPVAAVMPVSPFGAPIDYRSWEAFRDETASRRDRCGSIL